MINDLLDSLAGIPRLPGALCRGHHDVFDPPWSEHEDKTDREQRIAFALKLCRSCPALASCTQWLDSLPPKQRPHGVVAGQVA